MQLVESETVEFKCTFTPKLLKAVVAFANSNGGTLYIGIDDFGSIVGVDDIDATMLQCSNAITDGVYPDVSEITTVSALDIDGAALVKSRWKRVLTSRTACARRDLFPPGYIGA